jgi:chemotaxis protein methyltransferase CheR
MLTLSTDEFTLLKGLIEDECGIALQEDKQYLVENRLTSLMVQSGCDSFKAFYEHANKRINAELREKIVDAITTNETLWFRDESPYQTLAESVFPEFQKAGKRCKIWSAACSTGQEPFSIIMTAYEHCNPLWVKNNLSIFGSDISSNALKLAQNARYNTIAISRGLPESYKTKYFEADGPVFNLSSQIKDLVTFKKFNLQNSFSTLESFDIIFLRNVAIYFSHEFKVDLYKKLAGVLKPGGYLFIGASESLMGYSEDFELVEHNRCRYYRVK